MIESKHSRPFQCRKALVLLEMNSGCERTQKALTDFAYNVVSSEIPKGLQPSVYLPEFLIKKGVETMKIYTYPDPVLRQHAEPIEVIDDQMQGLIDIMIETMYEASGIGLAANQVGVPRRLIIFERSPGNQSGDPEVLINPEIVYCEGNITSSEACLSVVDFSADVTRSGCVRVRGLDRHGKSVELEAEDLKAICLQHEVDHLNGTLFIDHISSLKRSLYKKRLKKKLKQNE
jgi:peptide deformylase